MDYDPEAAPEPLDKAAQKRAIDAVLISGLIAVAVAGIAALVLFFAPGVTSTEPVPWILWGAMALAGVIHGLFQLHYLMRFMWGRGEWVTMQGPDWGDHETYFTSLIIVACAGGALAFLLAGANTFLR